MSGILEREDGFELKPCPLCGDKDYIVHVERYRPSYIKCASCDMQVRAEVCSCTDASPMNILFTLADNWNRRDTYDEDGNYIRRD